jgi:HK97 gp10 family phage protein
LASVTVKIAGLQQLGEAMRGLAADMNTKIATAATGRAAYIIKKRAKELAPVAPPEVTPRIPYASLRDNIVMKKVAQSQTPFTSEHLVVIRGGKQHDYASHVGSLLEFGTVKMAPRKFMQPAFDQEKGFALSRMIQAIREGIDKASGA